MRSVAVQKLVLLWQRMCTCLALKEMRRTPGSCPKGEGSLVAIIGVQRGRNTNPYGLPTLTRTATHEKSNKMVII